LFFEASDRRTNTPILGPLSVAHLPFGGGQSLAQIVRSRVGVATSDFPGFHENGAEARWGGPNESAVAG
jgi:hypothetical protein